MAARSGKRSRRSAFAVYQQLAQEQSQKEVGLIPCDHKMLIHWYFV